MIFFFSFSAISIHFTPFFMQFIPFPLFHSFLFHPFLFLDFDSFFPNSHAMSSGALSGKYSASKSHEIYHYPISIIQFRLSNVHTLNSWFRALAICFTYFKNGVMMTDVQAEEGFKHRDHLCYSFTSGRHFQSVFYLLESSWILNEG